MKYFIYLAHVEPTNIKHKFLTKAKRTKFFSKNGHQGFLPAPANLRKYNKFTVSTVYVSTLEHRTRQPSLRSPVLTNHSSTQMHNSVLVPPSVCQLVCKSCYVLRLCLSPRLCLFLYLCRCLCLSPISVFGSTSKSVSMSEIIFFMSLCVCVCVIMSVSMPLLVVLASVYAFLCVCQSSSSVCVGVPSALAFVAAFVACFVLKSVSHTVLRNPHVRILPIQASHRRLKTLLNGNTPDFCCPFIGRLLSASSYKVSFPLYRTFNPKLL